jgi:hypothetical protein
MSFNIHPWSYLYMLNAFLYYFVFQLIGHPYSFSYVLQFQHLKLFTPSDIYIILVAETSEYTHIMGRME